VHISNNFTGYFAIFVILSLAHSTGHFHIYYTAIVIKINSPAHLKRVRGYSRPCKYSYSKVANNNNDTQCSVATRLKYGGIFNNHFIANFFLSFSIFTAQCTLVHLRGLGIACRLSVCPSVTLVICNHIGWKSWKLIAQTISPAPSLLVAKRRSTYSQGNIGKFLGRLEVG